jgi:hypothetical protein
MHVLSLLKRLARRSVRLVHTLVWSSTLLAAPAYAQTDTGALRVLVTDATKGVLPGATVDVLNTATNDRRTGVTDGTGYAQFVPIVRGTYTLTVSLSGFQSVEVTNVRVDVSDRRFVPVTLQVAAASETIRVVSQSAVIQTEEGSLGQVIQGPVAVELPLAGRRYTELALLVPGTAPTSQTIETRGPGWFVSNGNYQTQNNLSAHHRWGGHTDAGGRHARDPRAGASRGQYRPDRCAEGLSKE